MNSEITDFIKHNYRHFNAAALVDAADAYEGHLDYVGKMTRLLLGREKGDDERAEAERRRY